MGQEFNTLLTSQVIKNNVARHNANYETLRSQFSATIFPSTPVPVPGQPCFRTDLGLDDGSGGTVGKWYIYSGNVSVGESGWMDESVFSPTSVEVVAARGTKPTLEQFLQVGFNDDGTPKATNIGIMSEWVLASMLTFTYVDDSNFKVNGDQTDIFLATRRIKGNLVASSIYTAVVSSTYAAGPDETTVELGANTIDNTFVNAEYSLVAPFRGALGGSLETGIKVTQPTLAAGTEIVEGTQLDQAILNFSNVLVYDTSASTGATFTVNMTTGELEVTSTTSPTPELSLIATDARYSNIGDSDPTTRSYTVKLSTPTLDSPADEAKDTNVTYTISDISGNADKVIFDPQSANFTYVSVGSGTGVRVGDVVEITGWTGNSVTITVQYTLEATYPNRGKSTEIAQDYTDSAYATDSITIVPSGNYEATLYTGNGTSDTINLLNTLIQVDYAHIKDRLSAQSHVTFDSVRGVNEALKIDTTDAETTEASSLTAFGVGSVSIGSNVLVNTNTNSYLLWTASLPTKNAANTDGTINTNVMTNDFMAAINWVGDGGATATLGHGLSVAPPWIELKSRDVSVTNFAFIGSVIGAGNFMQINSDILVTGGGTWTNATATVISLGNVGDSINTNLSNSVAVAYIPFAGKCDIDVFTVAGGVISGGDINVGFDIDVLDVKRTDASGDWFRMTKGNVNALKLNEPDTETTVGANPCGFGSNTISNVSLPDGDYIYKALAVGA